MMVRLIGGQSGRRLVFGFMIAAAAISMWISNIATTLMLFSIVLTLLEQSSDRRLSTALMLAIAYGSSLGGIGTLIGTPPNLIFMEVYGRVTGHTPGFLDWISWALPVVVMMLPLTALWISRGLHASASITLPDVDDWTPAERRTLIVFAVTVLLWITRTQPNGGWSGWLNMPDANDGSIALLAVVAMFLVPNGTGEKLLNWETAQRIPWGILILFCSLPLERPPTTKNGQPRPAKPDRDPLRLACYYQSLLDSGKFECRAALARFLGVSRARVSQVLNCLKSATDSRNPRSENNEADVA
jgi:sodium-dependent dicarboxylate transporter 2/3/5